MSMYNKPKISIVVIVYKMSRQAMNTIYSLSINHQKNINEQDYEIIVVENYSTDNLKASQVEAIGKNIKHFLREEKSTSPVSAINFGLQKCRASTICLMIDGARMVTPRILEYALMAKNIDTNFLMAVPGYNIGPHEHQYNLSRQYDQETEKALLEKTNWKTNGYRLFDICNISGANEKGVFHPLLECNCMFSSAENFDRIGGANMNFQLPGGGSINLHMFRQLGTLKETRHYFITPGEGSFHQFHGGITTQEAEDREEVLLSHRTQLHSYWEGGFHAMRREPILLGAVGSKAQAFLHYSSQKGRRRFGWMRNGGKHPWIDDFNLFASVNFNT